MTEQFNLLKDPWLPVVHASGATSWTTPAGIVDHTEDPIVTLGAPRPDLEAAATEFLIGLFQTALAPEDEESWLELHESPPGSKEITGALSGLTEAFHLFGEGPRFMQEMGLERSIKKGIEALLIDSPGKNTEDENKDVFIKRRAGMKLGPASTALALTTMQCYAPAGGPGNRTSLRGGGPLTTIVVGDDLWQTVWRNVIPLGELPHEPQGPVDEPAPSVFPWMGKARVSDAGQTTTPVDVHPLQAFWGMPRRIWLESTRDGGTCDLTGETCDALVEGFWTRPHGTNYEGDWLHPLSPHKRLPGGSSNTQKGKAGITAYRHWIGLIYASSEGDRTPALAIRYFLYQRARLLSAHPVRLAVFGYDMDKMKARAWVQGTLPALATPTEHADAFHVDVERCVRGADEAASALRQAATKALLPAREKTRGNLSWITDAFWSETEQHFVEVLERLYAAASDVAHRKTVRTEWRKQLAIGATAIFKRSCTSTRIEFEDIKRRIEAGIVLQRRLWGRKLSQTLDIEALKPRSEETEVVA